MDFPAICKHFGWDRTKLCGPVTMAFCKNPEENCCFGHSPGSSAHTKPLVRGKAFNPQEHREELEKMGLPAVQEALKAEGKANAKPPGQPKRVNGAVVYPARHFA